MGKRRRWQLRALSFLLALIMVLQDGAAVAVRAEEKNAGAVRTVQENTGSAGEETGSTAGDDGGTQDTGTPDGNDKKENTGGQNTDDKKPDTEEKPDTGKEEGKDPGTNPSGGSAADTETDQDSAGKDDGTNGAVNSGADNSGKTEADASDTSVSGNDILEDVSGNDPILREPENYYPDAEEEDYGELVAYDAYSRTYLTGEVPAAEESTGETGGPADAGKAGSEKQADVETGKASYVTVIGSSASYYIDEEGDLQKTDNTLSTGAMARYALGSLRYENGNGPMAVSLPEKLSESEGIYIYASGHTLELLPEDGDFTRSLTADNAIRYSDVFPGIDYQYTVLGDSLKEDVILLEETDRNTFSYLLRTDGLEAAIEDNQVILYEDSKEEPVYFLEAPEMEDAAGEMSFAVKLSLKETEEDT